MSKLRQLLTEKKFTLLSYLLEENAANAVLAEQSGADAIVVSDIDRLPEIAGSVGVPVGIDCSACKQIDADILEKMKRVDFLAFVPELLDDAKKLSGFTRVVALGDDYSIEQLMGLKDKGADALDAAILPGKFVKKELMVGDLQQYITVCISSGLPVIVPTQRMIRPSEVAIIEDAGAKGMILTSVVFGKSERSFEKAIREFRIAVDDLG